jgi:hypothetical protein
VRGGDDGGHPPGADHVIDPILFADDLADRDGTSGVSDAGHDPSG